MDQSDLIFGIIGAGENSKKLVEDFIYIFKDRLNIGETFELSTDLNTIKGKYDRYICCTFEQKKSRKKLRDAGLIYKKDYSFAEEYFSLLDDWKRCKIAYKSYPGSVKGWLRAIVFGYAAKHGKIMPRERNRDVLKGYYGKKRNELWNKTVQSDVFRRLTYAKYLVMGIFESLPQFFAESNSYAGYDYICFDDVSDAIRFQKDHPSIEDKVITVEELQTHTMGSLYMRAVYYDRRQNECSCDLPFKELWIGKAGTTRMCYCPDYLEISHGNIGVTRVEKVWKSTLAKIIRLSVINNTYTFCSRELCRHFYKSPDHTDLIERMKGLEETEHPKSITIAYDYICNLHCPSCRKKTYAKNAEKKEAEIKACTEALYNSDWLNKADELIIGGSGEVFLSKNYKRVLYDGTTKRNYIQIMTNGTLFTQKEWEKIEGKYDHICFSVSVDAATKETYGKVRCGGNFEQLMKNMEFLSLLRKDNKVDQVQVNMIVQKMNYKEIPDFIRWAKKMNFDRVYLSHIWNWGTYTDDEFENKVSMFDKNGKMRSELARILEDPICRDPIVDMRWE